jgi:glycosyltransferase involved in cell wall biosynthesis
VVVDDGCGDESPAIVGEFPGVLLLRHPAKGANLARRYGAQHCTAPLIIFLDQDDLWHTDHLRLLVDILERHPDCPAAVSGVYDFRPHDPLVFRPQALDAGSLDPWSWFPFNTIHTPSAVLIRRTALDAVGGWPTGFVGVADYYTWLRLSVSTPLVMQRAVTVGRRVLGGSYSAVLRAQGAEIYLSSHLAASEHVLLHRLAVRPDDAGRLRARLDILLVLLDILRAIPGCSEALLHRHALALEEGLDGEATEFIQTAYWTLFWYVYATLAAQDPRWRQVAWDILLEHWPDEAEGSRSQFLDSKPSNSNVDARRNGRRE